MAHMRKTVLVLVLVLLAASSAGLAPAQAEPMKLRSLKAISGPTPFSDCPFDAPPPFTENEWQPQDTALEPHLVVDPNDPRRMAAAWMQDFTQGIVVAYTHDGGRSWNRSIPPKLSECAGSEGASADPRLAFGGDGALYLSSMRNLHLRPGRTTPDNEVAVSASPDGGRTWRDPARIQIGDTYNDYPHVAADLDVPGRVYVTYTRATEPFGNALATMFAVSEDGGRTFSTPRKVFDTGRTGFYTNGRLLAQPGGRLLLLLWVFDGINYLPVVPDVVPSRIVALTSADGGRSWAEPVDVGAQSPTRKVVDPESGADINAGGPTVATSPDGGWYVAWQDYDGSRSRLNVVRGRRDGSWEQPREVLGWSERQILFPLVGVTPEGTVGLMWFDDRNDRPDDGKYLVDVHFAESRDGGASYREMHVAGPIDLLRGWSDARTFNGETSQFIGDYLAIAGRPRGFVAALPLTAPIAQVGKSQLFAVDVGEPAGKKSRAARSTGTKKKAERRGRSRSRRNRG